MSTMRKPVINSDQTVSIPAGIGYWDLTRFAWGGDFRRFKADTTAKLESVVETYADGSAKRAVAVLADGRRIGLQL